MALTVTSQATSMVFQPEQRRVSYFGMTREKYCMNCGRKITEETDLYNRRFCTSKCKEEYCSPIKQIVKSI